MPTSELKTLQRGIIAALRPHVDESRPSFRIEKDRYGEAILRLTGSAAASALDERSTSVVPYLETEPAKFWFSLSMELITRHREIVVKCLLIGVWRGEIATARKELIVRAEWGPRGEPREAGEHAQPHWHVHAPIEAIPLQAGSAFVDSAEDAKEFMPTRPNVSAGRLAIEEMHLAMAAQWHSEDISAHTAECGPDQIPGWVGGCAAYVRQQLIYIVTGD